MNRLLVLSLFSSLLITTAFPAEAQTKAIPFAGAPTQYSVDVVTTRKSGTPLLIRMYVDGAKRRTEQETNNGGLVVILRGDVHMMYTVLVARKLYRVSSFDPKLIEPFDVTELAKEIGVTREKVGTETINGEACDKYHYSSDTGKEKGSTKSGESQGSTSGFVWISQSTHLPVKSETAMATTIWQNLKVGPQEFSLFLPPTDFKPID
jgi:hypothetical protein